MSSPPAVTFTLLSPGRAPARPLVVLGPSLGTSTELWSRVAPLLAETHDVIAWDLPGHGRSAPARHPFTIADLAAAVHAGVDDILAERQQLGQRWCYAGVSVGGAVGLQLLLDAPTSLDAVALLCSGARIGDEAQWIERAGLVRSTGTAALIEGSARRWFAPGFLQREPVAGSTLLEGLPDVDAESYALVCEALSDWDVREQLASIATPLLVASGAQDQVTPPVRGREVAEGVPGSQYVEMATVAHLAPIEDPEGTAAHLRRHFGGAQTHRETYRAGMDVRREVLGDAHVDRAVAATTEHTADFQDLITRYAWGTIWTRPGLDRRARSIVTVTALVAHSHWDELAMHVRAALRNGLSRAEIVEVLMQCAVYVGVPAANNAFRVAHEVFAALDAETPEAPC